ncbi:glycosyltransferase family 2 protein [Patescibacteria group bacterium AH-259-L07]|nr:glycosyltransferase family 2 protein [Patescibacteria group bacterium AH-259-L07]
MTTLSIIIVNWNVKPLLERCLASIFHHGKELKYEVIVIDNDSRDGSKEYLRAVDKRRDNVHVILNNENLGFAKANNQGIDMARGEFILLLNPDAEVYGGTLQKMVRFMEKNSDCGVAGCQLVGIDNKIQPSVRKFPTVRSYEMIFLKLHYVFPRAKNLQDYFQYDFDYTKTAEVDQVMGAFLMIRRKVVDEIDMLDEQFFLWFEEVDFCKRAQSSGWKVMYVPEVRVLHHGSQSFGQMLPLSKQRIYSKSALQYFKKHFPLRSYWPLIILRPPSLLLAYLTQVFDVSKRFELPRRTRFR